MKTIEFEGFTYQVRRVFCDCYYGNKSIYHITTDNQRWNLIEIVRYILGSTAVSKGERDFLLNNPKVAFEAHFLEYYIGRFVESNKYPGFDGYYEITFIRPYDD